MSGVLFLFFAMLRGSFLLLLLGALCGGLYAAAQRSYRFAATDTASAQFRAKAMAWVLAGGVFAAVLGPQLVILTKDVWAAYLFAGTYLAQSGCAVLAAGVLTFLKIPKPARMRTFAEGRPLLEIPPACLHCRRCLRAGLLRRDQSDDDRGAARDGHVPPLSR